MTKKLDIDEHLFDKRVVERNIEKKIISREDYKAYLSQLEDEKNDCEAATVEKNVE